MPSSNKHHVKGDSDQPWRDGGDGEPRLDGHHSHQETPSKVISILNNDDDAEACLAY